MHILRQLASRLGQQLLNGGPSQPLGTRYLNYSSSVSSKLYTSITMSTPLVQAQYGSYAAAQTEKDTAYNERVASAFGYTTEDLVSIPQNANLGVSCGNPIAMAGLKEVCMRY